MPCGKISCAIKMNLEISGENASPATVQSRMFSRFRPDRSRADYRKTILSNGSHAGVFWPLTGQANGEYPCISNLRLGQFSPSDCPYFIPVRRGRICGVMKIHLDKPTGSPPPAAVPLPIDFRFRLNGPSADCREMSFGSGSHADNCGPLKELADINRPRFHSVELGHFSSSDRPYLIADRCGRISDVMKINFCPTTRNPPPVAFTGPGLRPELSANGGARRTIPAAQFFNNSVSTGVTCE